MCTRNGTPSLDEYIQQDPVFSLRQSAEPCRFCTSQPRPKTRTGGGRKRGRAESPRVSRTNRVSADKKSLTLPDNYVIMLVSWGIGLQLDNEGVN